MNDIALAKEQLRQQILIDRKVPYPESAELITENLFQLVAKIQPKRVAIYQSYPSEPRTLDFIANSPVPVIIPITEPDGNLSWQDLASGSEATIQPGDLLVIPALAIDHNGNRLGRGKGYFDKSLVNLGDVPVYAVIFEREYLESIPVEGHDQRVNGVVSEVTIREIN